MQEILLYLARFLVLMLILPMHEFAHGYIAYKNGDNTAKNAGRLTLNPLKHFDLVGLVCFLFVGFGWAKPVPVNPYNYKDYKKGSIGVAVAGVITNYILAFLFYPLMMLTQTLPYNYVNLFIYFVCYCGFALDLSFFVFNLIPIYPLDGFRVVDTFVVKRGPSYRKYVKYGYYVLIALMLISTMATRISALSFLNIFGYFMQFAVDIVGYPIKLFWSICF